MSALDEDMITDAVGCPHFSQLNDEAEPVLRKYRTVASWYMGRTHASRHPAKRRKVSSPVCGVCSLTLSRPFVCLQCSFSGCWADSHIQQHLRGADHIFCVDSRSGSIFCIECDDFVYDGDFDELYESIIVSAEEKFTKFQEKTPREPFKQWIQDSKDLEILDGTSSMPCQSRRGFLNLGQTCFLNAILQSFLANPLLRSFFLSDKHNERLCKNKDCTCCELDKLFAEVYSGKGTPLGPTSFLSTTWRASPELSGYSQHDAHEFFITTLNQIHATFKGSTKMHCICIVHTTFDGLLQSDVKCERCGNVTTTTDPMLDISLEIGKTRETAQEVTLASCLRRYTQPEKLGTNDYTCVKCGKAAHASKRLSFSKLPPVLSFQFKRFEHPSADKASAKKIETPVRFPAHLNMAEFTALGLQMQDGGKTMGPKHSTSQNALGPDGIYEYDLFCVICHDGQIDNGHYVAFTRYFDEWYRFDDDKVTHSSLGDCLNTQAYMCFYVKRHLDYKPYMTPSYVKAREVEAAKEKERERQKEAARMKEVDDALLAVI